MKAFLVILVVISTCCQAQGIKDTSFVVRGLFRVKLTNQDADEVIRNDYLLVEVQNISGKDVYFFNQSGDSRTGLGDYIRNNVKYIIFGEREPNGKIEQVELQKLEVDGKIVKSYMSSTDEKGILFSYLPGGTYISTDKKKSTVSRSAYVSNLKSQAAMIPQ